MFCFMSPSSLAETRGLVFLVAIVVVFTLPAVEGVGLGETKVAIGVFFFLMTVLEGDCRL